MNLTPFPQTGCIHGLSVPLPGFQALICSNMYVLGKGPITLIDSAPKFPGSLFTMERQLGDIGFPGAMWNASSSPTATSTTSAWWAR
jgi:hypothetical protein